jgi:hypothetical protein
MAWKRQNPFTIAKPVSPSSGRWIITGVFSVITAVLLFVLHASGSLPVLNIVNIWLFSLIPIVLWLLVFCISGYLFGRALEHYHFLQNEAAYAQQRWTAWAERYLAVPVCCLMLPNHISALLLAQNAGRLAQYPRLVRRIDSLDKNPSQRVAAIRCLLTGIKAEIRAIPQDIPIQITLLTDEPETTRQECYQQLADCWQARFPDRAGPYSLTLTDQLSFHALDERLRQPDVTVQLVLVMQLQGGELYSDGLAALLFTSDDVAQKYSLPHCVRLLRPMPLNVDNLADELTLFLTTQTQACQTTRIVADHQKWTASSAAILETGSAQGAGWLADNILTIETYCGIQGPFSPWFAAALAADFVRTGQQPCLGLSTTGAESFVYTITAGSGDEPTK